MRTTKSKPWKDAPIGKARRRPKKEPLALSEMKLVLLALDLRFDTEYRFAAPRRFRFDMALLQHRIAIEYEGLMSEKSRHTTVTGYTKDAEKYNLAQTLGWRVLRYTALNYRQMAGDVEKLIKPAVESA